MSYRHNVIINSKDPNHAVQWCMRDKHKRPKQIEWSAQQYDTSIADAMEITQCCAMQSTYDPNFMEFTKLCRWEKNLSSKP